MGRRAPRGGTAAQAVLPPPVEDALGADCRRALPQSGPALRAHPRALRRQVARLWCADMAARLLLLVLSVVALLACGGGATLLDGGAGGGSATGGGLATGGGAATGGGGGFALPPWDGGLPRVQCRFIDDCPGQSRCSVTAPGGLCNGCGGAADCPLGTTCSQTAVCVRGCTRDADCGTGMQCTVQGICGFRSCSSTSACAPYTCSSGLCRRPTCSATTSCPAPLNCVDGGVCVEP